MIPLRVENLVKRFDAAREAPPAVDDVSFQVDPNEVLALVGPSGCGKTTTLRMIAGFEKPDAGSVWLGEEMIEGPRVHMPPEKRRIGLVFQELALFPHLDVLHNVMFGLKSTPRSQRRARAMEALDVVHMAAFADRKPHQLSGGERQRVALARSLAPKPRIILLDEPFSNLDPALRHAARSEIRSVLKSHGMAALLVTHDQEEALSFADRIGVMNQGRLLQTGTPQEVYTRPANAFVAQFLGRTNLVRGQATGEHAETPLGPICLNCSTKGTVTLSIRPEHLRIIPPVAGQPVGCIKSREFKGHDLTLVVCFGDHQYIVQTDYSCPFHIGDQVSLAHVEPAVVVEAPK